VKPVCGKPKSFAGRRAASILLCWVAVVNASAQKKVPPPPKPADAGPSLEVTMKFVQDKLNDIGPVNYAGYGHDNAVGTDWTYQSKVEITKVVADRGACRISFHLRVETNGAVTQDTDAGFPLKAIGDVVVMPLEQDVKQLSAEAGHPAWTFRVDPPAFVLKAHRTDIKGTNDFDFYDEQMANRVAKAIVHAVELCGGGGKPEPF
jgi:hypothetical protein